MRYLNLLMLLCLGLFLNGCTVVEGIFKAGMWWGILLVVGVIALIVFILSKLGGKK